MEDALGERWDRDTPGLEIPSQIPPRGFTVYLAGPIHGKSDSEAIDWRKASERALHRLGYMTRNPMDRDYRGREGEEGIKDLIVEGDKEDIENSDIILAYIPDPSAGTSMEILFGNTKGLLIIAIVPDLEKASPWIHYHTDELYTTFEEAYASLKRLMKELQ